MAAAAFAVQLLLGITAIFAGRSIGAKPRAVWVTAALIGIATVLAVLSTRIWPAAAVHLLGAPVTACIEMTAWAIPTLFVLMIGSRQLPRERDRRAMWLLVALGAGFACKSGLWMVLPPLPVTEKAAVQAGVCRQTTGAT